MKILYFDIETTGLDEVKNDILTLSALVEVDGKIIDTIDLQMQPFNYDNISKEALEINKLMSMIEVKKDIINENTSL